MIFIWIYIVFITSSRICWYQQAQFDMIAQKNLYGNINN